MKYSYSHLSSPAPLPPLLTVLTKSTQLILPRYLILQRQKTLELYKTSRLRYGCKTSGTLILPSVC